MELARQIKGLTKPDDVLLILGFDWSPVIPYYCERRALMVPATQQVELIRHPDAFTNRVNPAQIGALIIRVRPHLAVDPASLRRLLGAYALSPHGRRVGFAYGVFAHQALTTKSVADALHY
jgi:hypothetical protein